ncbi:erythromycin esterase family protein [Streptomyces sp. SID8352]|uniref:erythromycin esterase family protein n=1 Tax=Streptomyces sp. SID8352 TaxID=2690338 RepID=UPI00136A4E46|nr:erythromycin esterase family protein [Streptomyces sp. SID8352]MYU20726.1 erythromycin esterase family protein [Streptomyces sp. SID8352]
MMTDDFPYPAVDRFLARRPRPPRVLALGEPLHGVETFPLLRNALLRGLVEHRGTRLVALESDCLKGRLVDAHVRGDGTALDPTMSRGFSHGWGDRPSNRALVEWLGARNRGAGANDAVGFAGFDAPMEITGAESPRAALRLLHGFLTDHAPSVPHPWERIDALLGDDVRWTHPRVMWEPSRSVGDTADARELRVITDDLQRLLAGVAPRYAAGDTAGALRDAELGARTAAGLLAYHRVLAETGPEERMSRALGLRDTMMAENLAALADRERGRGPLLAFAHNQHLRRGVASMRMTGVRPAWSPAGAHLDRALGPEYVVIALAIGSAPHLGIDAPPPDSVEGRLCAASPEPRLVSGGELARLRAGSGDLTARGTDDFAYFPLDPDGLDDYDAILFLPRLAPPPPGAATP